MSGFPALRCFIFFAADLFILVLHPSIGNSGEISQEFSRIFRVKVRVDRVFVSKPRDSCDFVDGSQTKCILEAS
jgi:hypothetical protein